MNNQTKKAPIMSIQYTDGSFSDNMPIDFALEEFQHALDVGTARALFVGNDRELNAIKNKKKLEEQIQDLSSRIDSLETSPIKSETIIIPTKDEMVKALRNKIIS